MLLLLLASMMAAELGPCVFNGVCVSIILEEEVRWIEHYALVESLSVLLNQGVVSVLLPPSQTEETDKQYDSK